MKRRVTGIALGAAVGGLVLLGGRAFAQYRPPPRQEEERPQRPAEGFEEAVSLSRFRRGNPDWDTQELIAAGLTALHEEHLKILKELEGLKAELARLKGKQEQ